MNSGVPNSEMSSENDAASRTPFTRWPPSRRGGAASRPARRSPSQRRPLSRLDFSRTTSPGARSPSSEVVGGVGVGHPLARERGGDGAGPLPHRHEVVEAQPCGIRPDGRVLRLAVVAELEHAAEHGPPRGRSTLMAATASSAARIESGLAL